MEKVAKVYFDPLMGDLDRIRALLKTLPVGSAHPFHGELLVHSQPDVIESIDISMHPEDYFANAVSLGDLGEDVLRRMKLFSDHIGTFNSEYSIQQAPSSTFNVPIVDGEIHIFAVSAHQPTYYDLCVGEAECRTCCFQAPRSIPGISHSSDVLRENVLLQHMKLDGSKLDEEARAVFVSGYSYTALHKYKVHNPLVLVANHYTKTLYTIPVPLDTATIGQATLCCPLVIKKLANGTLFCSILPNPSTDDTMCSGSTLSSSAFKTAIQRATLIIEQPVSTQRTAPRVYLDAVPVSYVSPSVVSGKEYLLIATHSARLPTVLDLESTQVMRFGKGIHWMNENQTSRDNDDGSVSVLPCILGGVLEGPLLLVTGEAPSNVPFQTMAELHNYYKRMAKSTVVVVDENMTDNARNLASTWRLNATFIVQADFPDAAGKDVDITSILNKVNVNAITALAGPQSLVLVQLGTNHYFYRGMADPEYLDTSRLKFGQDVTEMIFSPYHLKEAHAAQHPSWPVLVNLAADNPVYLPNCGNSTISLEDLRKTIRNYSLKEIQIYKDDIVTMVPQLQTLLPQDRLQEFCQDLIFHVQGKVTDELGPIRKAYTRFVVHEYDFSNAESRKKKDWLMSDLRKRTKQVQERMQWLTDALGNIVSAQTTSSRSHDLQRLARQTTIQSNVSAAKNMTFEHLSNTLEQHAGQMGVLVVNVDTEKYQEYLSKLPLAQTDGSSESLDTCFMDSRNIYLEGLDAGIVLEQSQQEHEGPLVSKHGPEQPILALPYLNKNLGSGSMLAWVCWDEFVNLRNPYSLRWMEKCNDKHIAALRIMMRSTLSEAVSSRQINLQPSSPATGQLMGALLMTAMRKLADTRNTPSITVSDPDDTSTLLMRGLFGNLLTIAGSGTQPFSYVWQLFGKLPQLEIPSSAAAWSWYENTARLLPYSGWPLETFKANLTALLDKAIFRMMTKNGKKGDSGAKKQVLRIQSLQDYCRARNIQLMHSRTIVVILEKMLTELEKAECQEAAKRLLEVVPEQVEHGSTSYYRLDRYIRHLAKGGDQRQDDNLIAANVFTKRSAIFSQAKNALSKLMPPQGKRCYDDRKEKIVYACQQALDAKIRIEKKWNLEPGSVKVQNFKTIQDTLDACLEPVSKDAIFSFDHSLVARAKSDGEINRKPWQVGVGELGEIEPLDQKLVSQILGKKSEAMPDEEKDKGKDDQAGATLPSASQDLVPSMRDPQVNEDDFEPFEANSAPGFIESVKNANSVEDVCKLLGPTVGAMEAFVEMLAPEFHAEERLPTTFKAMVLSLLRNRSRNAEKVKPAKMLLGAAPIVGGS